KIMLGHRGPSIATDCHQFIAAPGVAPNSAAYRSALPARHFRIGSVQAAVSRKSSTQLCFML
ncbi:MAG: hypothetical protein KJS74_02805, partial [Rhodospirillales bacterium]|nr:hypothetical protein [Rhodospirillales bacterium]